jgi:tetratricopeptide (TPR) repeat protein
MDVKGKDIVLTDGWWIIILGVNGYLGLASLMGTYGVPVVALIRRHPVSTWADPDLVPAAAMAITLGLYSVDNLSNAIPTALNPLIAGGVVGLPAATPRRGRSRLVAGLEDGDRMAAEGRLPEAASAYREAIAAAPAAGRDAAALRDLAAAHARMADVLEAGGDLDGVEAARREALSLRERVAGGPGPGLPDHRELAIALEDLARALADRGRDSEAEELRLRAVARWAELAPSSRDDYDRWVLALNDLAWLLATSTDPATRDADRAVLMAGRAVREAPGLGACWNTLGMARLRAGDDRGAVEALGRSIDLGPPGGTAFDLLILALALRRLGDEDGARDAFARGAAWADRHRPGHPGLARLLREARELLGDPAERRALIDRG